MRQTTLDVDRILTLASQEHVADVHFTAGLPIQVRKDGSWGCLNAEPLTPAVCEEVVGHLLGTERMERFLTQKEADLSYSVRGVGRFRVNAFFQRGSMGAAVRVLPFEVPEFSELGLPTHVMERLCALPHGIVLVCGATGSGKSTTLASMIGHINRSFSRHVVTIEDPIEFLHTHNKSFIDQREVGTDTRSFAEAMKHVLRQSPDVVMVGELRDRESVRTGLMIAETGHLVLSTIHSGDTTQGLSRIVDMFPPDQLREIRVSLAVALQGMIAQQLIATRSSGRLTLAHEVMLANGAIRNLVREGKFEQVYNQIQTRQDEGMHTMNASLIRLWKEGEISGEGAVAKSPNPMELKAMMGNAQSATIHV